MSGHSKWSKIKREKQSKDKQKSGVFSKLARMISLAVTEGGGIAEPENNIRLRLAITKAKSLNFPKENIERAIEKGKNPGSQSIKEIIYEGFGPQGINFIIQTTTDNSNRTFTEIRNTLDQHEAKLGSPGSALHSFRKCGLAVFGLSDNNETAVFAFAEKVGAFDLDKNDSDFNVYFPYENVGKMHDYLGNLKEKSVEVIYKPLTLIEVTDESIKDRFFELIEALEELDDVHKVFNNAKI